MGCSPFQVVYGQNPLSPLDLIPITTNLNLSSDAEEKAKQFKKLHE
jgi:hypothetical protein